MPTGFPSPANPSSSPPTPMPTPLPPPSLDPPARLGWAPRTRNPPPFLLQASSIPRPNLLRSTPAPAPDDKRQPGVENLCLYPSGGFKASAASADWGSQRLGDHQHLPLGHPPPPEPFLLLLKERGAVSPLQLCWGAVSECGGSWQPWSDHPCFWAAAAAALLGRGGGSDPSLSTFKGYKPYSDPRQGVPPSLVPQDPQGCAGAGPRAVPTPALPLAAPLGAQPEPRLPGGCRQGGQSPPGLWVRGVGSPGAIATRLLVITGQGRGDRLQLTTPTCPVAPPMCVLGQQHGWVPPDLPLPPARGQGAVGSLGPV